jgi:hypothetical protein
MKTKSIQTTVYPLGWTGNKRGFNNWQRSLQRQLDKINGTDIAIKYKVN